LTSALQLSRAVLVLYLLAQSALASADDEGKQLAEQIIKNAQACAVGKSGSDVPNCYIDATPERCRPQMMEYLAREDKEAAKRTWYVCVASCANAGVWSKTFGDCSRRVK